MTHDSRLMAHGSCLKALGSRLMAHDQENLALGPGAWGTQRQIFLGHEPWAMSHGPISINNRWMNRWLLTLFFFRSLPWGFVPAFPPLIDMQPVIVIGMQSVECCIVCEHQQLIAPVRWLWLALVATKTNVRLRETTMHTKETPDRPKSRTGLRPSAPGEFNWWWSEEIRYEHMCKYGPPLHFIEISTHVNLPLVIDLPVTIGATTEQMSDVKVFP